MTCILRKMVFTAAVIWCIWGNIALVQAAKSVTAVRITNNSAPLMDGKLDDIWQQAGRISFPNPDGGKWTIDYQHYDEVDPSTFTVYFLHDDINLYVAIVSNDKQIEKSDYNDQSSDGLAGMCLQRKGGGGSNMYRLLMFQEYKDYMGADTIIGPPVDRDNLTDGAEWRASMNGTWNDDRDQDSGYIFEFTIPLANLNGYMAGDSIKANMVFADHDSNPNGVYNGAATNFCKLWWGKDTPEDLSEERYIILGNNPPIGRPGDNKNVVATRILPSAAPVIDGIPDEDIWNEAAVLNFPNSVGQGWSPGTQAVYNGCDPSNYTVKFLHDDSYLYVAVTASDTMIEPASDDQSSDGLISLVFDTGAEGKDKRFSYFWFALDRWENELHFQEGPPRYPYETANITWAPQIEGTFNLNTDRDTGYTAEFKIPLEKLGGITAGSQIPANIIFHDHDNNPGGAYNDPNTRFRRFWWGTDHNEFYDSNNQRYPIPSDKERYVTLGTNPPVGTPPPPLPPDIKAINYIANQQVKYSGFIRSYPDEQAAHTYDNAVALIALTAGGKQAQAKALAEAFMSVIEQDYRGIAGTAFFYDSYGVIDKRVSQGCNSGTGPNAWAALALALYGKKYHDENAMGCAQKVAKWIVDVLYQGTDGVYGGVQHPRDEHPGDNHQKDTVFDFVSIEQLIDVWHLFRVLEMTPEADNLLSCLMATGKGWVDVDSRNGRCDQQSFRFATGFTGAIQDMRLYLDPQSWGSIVANITGYADKADGAIAAAEDKIALTISVNEISVSGFNDLCLPCLPDLSDNCVVWYGGTAQMIVAYVYDHNMSKALYYLNEMAKVQLPDGSWPHSSLETSKHGEYESYHTSRPSAGETAWNYFALRDVNYGQRLPYFTFFPGDLNNDGMLDQTDYDIFSSYLAGTGTYIPDYAVVFAVDLNGDGLINIVDLVWLTILMVN